jgi:hypothetical protein
MTTKETSILELEKSIKNVRNENFTLNAELDILKSEKWNEKLVRNESEKKLKVGNVYIYIYMYIYIFIYIHIYIDTYDSYPTPIYTFICIYTYIYIHVYLHIAGRECCQ